MHLEIHSNLVGFYFCFFELIIFPFVSLPSLSIQAHLSNPRSYLGFEGKVDT